MNDPSTAIGRDVAGWACHGMPTEPLTSEQRASVIHFADGFEECSHPREELARMTDHRLIDTCFAAMADYARGQL